MLFFFFSPRVKASKSIRFYFLLSAFSYSLVFSLVSLANRCFFCFIMNLWILPESIKSSLLPLGVGLVLSAIFLINFLSTTAAVDVIRPPIDFCFLLVTEETGWMREPLV
jgi:ABC-type bacteriocin/lantibiotic exporter with double-glycine peptidase domain